MNREPPIGTVVLVDGRERVVVEAGSRYAGRRPHPVPGVKVRPIEGGRARVVALHRLTEASE